MNRRAQAAVMMLLGVAVLQASLTDTYLRYVKPGLKPFLIVAALLLIATAVSTWYYQWRRDPAHVDDHPADDAHAVDEHGHGGQSRVVWLLLLPVVVLSFVAPPALGADAAARSGVALSEPESDFEPLPPGDPASISLLEYAVRAVYDQGRSLAGRQVRVIGFVMVENGQTYLARMIVRCCAADARPIKVALSGSLPADQPPDTWLAITGGYDPQTTKDPINGATIPFLAVTEFERIDMPNSPYQV